MSSCLSVLRSLAGGDSAAHKMKMRLTRLSNCTLPPPPQPSASISRCSPPGLPHKLCAASISHVEQVVLGVFMYIFSPPTTTVYVLQTCGETSLRRLRNSIFEVCPGSSCIFFLMAREGEDENLIHGPNIQSGSHHTRKGKRSIHTSTVNSPYSEHHLQRQNVHYMERFTIWRDGFKNK